MALLKACCVFAVLYSFFVIILNASGEGTTVNTPICLPLSYCFITDFYNFPQHVCLKNL